MSAAADRSGLSLIGAPCHRATSWHRRRSQGTNEQRTVPDGSLARRLARSLVHRVIVRRRGIVDAHRAPMSNGPCLMVRSLEDSLAPRREVTERYLRHRNRHRRLPWSDDGGRGRRIGARAARARSGRDLRSAGRRGITLALVVQQHGEVVVERYGVRPANLFETEAAPITADTPLVSWSIAKSITHAAVGILVGDGRIDRSTRRRCRSGAGTEKEAITLLDLLEMRSGLAVRRGLRRRRDVRRHRHAVRAGAKDHAAYAAAHAAGAPARQPCGATRRARRTSSAGSSATSSSAIPRPPGEREAAMRAFLDQRLFGPVGMPTPIPGSTRPAPGSARPTCTRRPASSPASASSTCATASSATTASLPAGWVDQARTVVAHDPETGLRLRPPLVGLARPAGLARRPRLRGPVRRSCCPSHDAVVVHLGKTDATVRDRLVARLRRIDRARCDRPHGHPLAERRSTSKVAVATGRVA